jgi:hypothetical protein
MQPKCLSSRLTERHSEIADLIRSSYNNLRQMLPSPYVDGHEMHDALDALGHDLSGDYPGTVAEVLGWKCMRLPAANIEGRPKYYLPLAMPRENPEATDIPSQTAAFVTNLRMFGSSV